MATVVRTTSDITQIREGESSNGAGHDVGGSSPQNACFMAFPSFDIPAGSQITGAVIDWAMTSVDYGATARMSVQASAHYDSGTITGLNQPALSGSVDAVTDVNSTIETKNIVSTNAARQMIGSGVNYCKLWFPNGNNRKHFAATATMTVTYTEPTKCGIPSLTPAATISAGTVHVACAKGIDGTLNVANGVDVYYAVKAPGGAFGGWVFVSNTPGDFDFSMVGKGVPGSTFKFMGCTTGAAGSTYYSDYYESGVQVLYGGVIRGYSAGGAACSFLPYMYNASGNLVQVIPYSYAASGTLKIGG